MSRRRWIALGVLLTVAVLAITQRQAIDLSGLVERIESLGLWAPVAFVWLYALSSALFVPGSLLTIAGGALFGLGLGTAVNLVGATLGATLAFVVSRTIASDWVAERAGPRLGRIIAGVEAEGWRFVALVRLVPVLPFTLLNYALGLTRIPIGPYVVASFAFMLPGSAAFTYLGVAGRAAAEGSGQTITHALIALSGLGLMAFLPRLIKRLRAKP